MNKDKNKFNSGRLLVLVFLICVFLLGIIKIEAFDTWTHLSLGRVIFENQGFPEKEPFSYPSLNRSFADAEWLFDVVFYLAYALFDLYGVILLKAAFITATFYILLKDSLVPDRELIASVVVVTFAVFMTRHRFVERPDIAMMLFLSFVIYALNSFVAGDKKYIYVLPLTQVIWANMHPSITLVAVPFCAFIFGGTAQRILNRLFGLRLPFTPSNRKLLVITAVFVAVLGASFINPYASHPFTAPVEMIGTSWYSDEITELQRPDWENFKMPYLLTAAILLSFLVNIRKIPLIHLFLVLPFIYIAFSGVRFMFILGIVGAPVIVRNIAGQFSVKHGMQKKLNLTAAVVLIAMTALSWAGVRPFSLPQKMPGFGINYEFVPEGALRYLDSRNIYGRVFNTYHWGGYITWRDFPRRAAFVDGRGNISHNLLEALDTARTNPAVMKQLQSTYGFNVAVLDYKDIDPSFLEIGLDKDLALYSENWALVYWDDLAMVYLRKGAGMDDIIEQDMYRYVVPANGPSVLKAKLHDREFVDGLIRELKRNIEETRSYVGYAFLGFIYNELGMYEEAVRNLSKVRDFPFLSNLYNAYQGLGYAYNKLGEFDLSVEYYGKALDLKQDASVLYSLGVVYLKKGEREKGVECLEQALEINKNLLSIYPLLISIYREQGDQESLDRILRMYNTAKRHGQAGAEFQKGVRLYMEGKYKQAIKAFEASIAVNPNNPAAYNDLGYIYYDLGMYDKAFMYQQKAVELDMNMANAHYGLALLYKKAGNREMAKKHWQEYLRIEPKGYYSRKAKKELREL